MNINKLIKQFIISFFSHYLALKLKITTSPKTADKGVNINVSAWFYMIQHAREKKDLNNLTSQFP